MKSPILKLAVSVGCIAALLWLTDASGVWARLQGARSMWVGFALLAVTAATWSMARRWQIAARALGIEISYPVALREYYLGQLVNSALPGGVVGDVARAVRLRHEKDLNRAAQSVVAERLLGQIAMFTVLLAGFAVALKLPGGIAWPMLSWAIPIGLGLCTLAALIASRVSVKIGRFTRLVLQLQRKPEILLLAALTPACLIFGFYASARATGTLIPAEGWATLIPLVLCAMLIPFSVGGWGWREGAAAALFPVIGATTSAGVAAGITYGGVVLIAALPAGLILLRHYILKIIPTLRRSHPT